MLELQVVPNLGRNFGPLLTQFGKVLCANYDVIGHIHTKKSAHADRSIVEAWRKFLLENMIGGEMGGAMLDAIHSSMALDPSIGIVFPDDPNVMSWTDNRGHANALAARMKCGKLPENFNFPIGSMFWVRSSILFRFVELDLDWSDYPSEPAPTDGTFIPCHGAPVRSLAHDDGNELRCHERSGGHALTARRMAIAACRE